MGHQSKSSLLFDAATDEGGETICVYSPEGTDCGMVKIATITLSPDVPAAKRKPVAKMLVSAINRGQR